MSAAPDPHPERRAEQVSAAHAVLADLPHHHDATIRAACDTLLALSADPHDRTLARAILAILDTPPPPATHGRGQHPGRAAAPGRGRRMP
jgi:hypothetical protein